MTEFTKGKWEVVQGAGIDEFDVFSKDAPLHNHICVLFGYPVSRWNEQKANARLIAAAPQMYELLKSFAYTQEYDNTVSAVLRTKAEELIVNIDGN